MFIESRLTSPLAPFEGAEDNQTLTIQESLRSFERSPRGESLRSIDISPLNVKQSLTVIFRFFRGLFTNQFRIPIVLRILVSKDRILFKGWSNARSQMFE